MKENVLDVLMYLFENCMDESPEIPPDHEALTTELAAAGFSRREISKAFSWLDGLARARTRRMELLSAGRGGLRHYHPSERKRLDAACRGFLLAMEASGVLDPVTRELVLERIMALDLDEVSLEQLKWVMWMVLFHQSGQEYAYRALEGLVFDERPGPVH